MARLELTLFGGFRGRLAAGQLVTVPTRKTQALLAYLALPLGQYHSRDKIASLLWGQMQDHQARASVRQALFHIRKSVPGLQLFRVEGDTVSLDPAVVTADTARFEAKAAEASPAALAEAAELYRGELLEGLALDEPPFEDWLVAERERMRQLALETLARLLAQQRDAGSAETAIQTALRLLALDPLQEPVHRTLMRLHADLGRRASALRQYQLCVDVLKRDVDAEPEEETKALYRTILQRGATRGVAGTPAPQSERRTAAAPEPLAREIPLVGRDAEMARLSAMVDAVLAGHGQFVGLVGEAGIGKSRLAAEVAGMFAERGGRVLVGRSYETEQALPFAPWVDALRSGGVTRDAALLATLDPVWRAQLARVLPEVATAGMTDGGGSEINLFEGVIRLLDVLAAERPLLVLFEDGHWADATSLRLIQFAVRRIRSWPILFLTTVRVEETASLPLHRQIGDELAREGLIVRLHVGPLAQAETLALARELRPAGGDTARSALDDAIWETSAGNPFIVVETMRALAELPAALDCGELPLPARVRHLVDRRLDRLTAQSRRLVDVAAVIGRQFDFALLQRAAQLSEDDAAEGVEELVRRRILHQAGEGLEFTHDRIRAVAHEALLAPRRALLHRRVAEALEVLRAGSLDAHALAIGTHYREAGVWDKSVTFLRQAGIRASARGAPREAVTCFQEALAALGRVADGRERDELTSDLSFELGRALYVSGEFDRSITRHEEALKVAEALGDDRRIARVCGGLTYLLGSEGDHAGAVKAGERAVSLAASVGDVPLQVWTSISLGRQYFALGDYRRGIERTRWAVDALERLPVEVRPGGVRALLPAVGARTWLALCLARMGDYPDAIAWAENAVRLARATAGPQEQVWADYALARIHLGRGHFDKGVPLLEEAFRLSEGGRFPIYFPRVLSSLGVAYAQTARSVEALPMLERAVAEAEAIKLLYGHAMVLTQLGDFYLQAERLDEAQALAVRALDLTRRHGERGDEAWALHLLAGIAAARRPLDLASVANGFGAAMALAEELGMRPLQARCHLGLGALYHRAGDPRRARMPLARATELFGAMEMLPWLRDVEALQAAATRS